MNPETPGSGPAVPPGPEPAVASFGPATPPGPAPSSGPAPSPTLSGGASWGDWLSGSPDTRAARKAERRARRDARRAERGWGGPFWGVLLVIIGAGFLASELIPAFDWNLAWPVVLIAFGVLLVAASMRRPPVAS